jgi:homocysteine S-methyltransferase
MSPTDFADFIHRHPVILAEGAVIERLRRNPAVTLDPVLVNSAFIYEEAHRSAIEAIYREYLEIGRAHDLPLMMSTPTWRATAENITAAGYGGRDVNADNVRFIQELRASAGPYAAKIVIGGLIGCRGDAYRPDEALTASAARDFHGWQAQRLAEAGADFLFAVTLPALSEAMGIAQAIAATGRPGIISFVVRPTGTLLDGTPLKDAIAAIDASVTPRPVAYLINCTHPDFARDALYHPLNSSPQVRERIIGLLANTAALSPEALDGQEHVIGEEPARFAAALHELRLQTGLKVLGGCCGTDDRHIHCLAERLAPQD